jgi:type II secretory pathway predicted ATPase ExeA
MYTTHFGLRQRPFRSAPDPAAYYPSGPHEAALHLLLDALADGDGLALLTGDPGTGKTLLATILLDRLGEQASCVFLTNGHLTRRADLFQAVLYDLGLPYAGLSEQELRLALTDRLLADFAAGRKTVLVLDEAHHLPPDVIEELRLLGNLETRAGRAVQIVLVAQPPILDTLRRPELRAVAQRLTARAELGPLTPEEAADYLLHHLRQAGARPEALIGDDALGLIARATGGLPRLLNQAANLALALTYQAGAGRVDAEGALEALARLGLEAEELPGEPVGLAAEDEPPAAGAPAVVIEPFSQSPRLVYAPGRSG